MESFRRVAVSFSVCAASIDGLETGSETEIAGAWISMAMEAELTVTGVVAWSVTDTVNVELPAAVGVPEIAPVELLRLSPAGRVPEATAKVLVPEPPEEDAELSV